MLHGPHIDVVGVDVLLLALGMFYRQLLREK
jgi:hypothetical protein